jgi:hypothetical protein
MNATDFIGQHTSYTFFIWKVGFNHGRLFQLIQ